MKIIKLNAIDSTNSFLKELVQTSTQENYTTVVTNSQTNGRGQQESSWYSKPNKNLTFSVFIRFDDLKIDKKKYLNFAISLAVYEVLFAEKLPKLSIKWPNDILSANKKICGILIENTIKGSKISAAIVGIGLNVNQENFPISLKNATSLQIETNTTYSLDTLLHSLIEKIKEKINLLNFSKFKELEAQYLQVLYKIGVPTMFKDIKGNLFLGIITEISKHGNLIIQLEDDSYKEFGIKEVGFI
ncbi:biotin--[acetyl-CoA-carboxylase] ligase [Polaribacter sp.]|uniref:biotin--[acetyl-CoA-carboxylase] ligase n=1 Tax=Polaribacter sp. TaxID=1920175 RepID=UPI003EFA4BF3